MSAFSQSLREGPAQPRQPQEGKRSGPQRREVGVRRLQTEGGDVLASHPEPNPGLSPPRARAPASRSQTPRRLPGSAGSGDSVGIHRVQNPQGGKPPQTLVPTVGRQGREDLCSHTHAPIQTPAQGVRARPLGCLRPRPV